MKRPTTRKLLRFAALLAALVLPATLAMQDARAGTTSHGESAGTNRVTGLSVEETDTATLLRIGVASEPTFSVFKLRSPSRLLVEVSDCGGDGVAPLSVRNGVVDSATVTATSEDGTPRCRVIVSLDEDAPFYDVDTTANAIVISVDGAGRQLQGGDPQLSARLADREAELERTRGALDTATTELDGLRAEREAALSRVSELETRQRELDAQLSRGTDSSAELDQARQELEALRAELGDKRSLADTLKSRADNQSEKVASLSGQVDALKSERDEALERISELATERDHAARRAEAAETRASELSGEVDRLRDALERTEADAGKATELGGQLASAEAEQARLEKRLEALQNQVASGSAEAEQQLAEAERAVLTSTREASRLREQLEAIEKKAQSDTASLKSDLETRQRELDEAQTRAESLRVTYEGKVAELGTALAERDAELARRESELETLRQAEARLRDELASARQSEATEVDVATKQDEINDLKRRQAKLTTEMQQEVGALETALADREAALERARGREAELLAKYDTLKTEREKEQVAVSALITNKETRLEEARQTEIALREELAALRSELEVRADDPALNSAVVQAEAQLEQAVGRQTSLQGEVDQLSRRLEENQAEVERVRAQAESASSAARERETALSAEISRLETLSQRTQDQLADAARREAELTEQVAALNAQLDEVSSASNEREAELQAEVERLRGAVESGRTAQAEVERLRDEVASGRAAREQLEARLAEQPPVSAADEAEVSRLRERVAELEAGRSAEKNEALSDARAEVESLRRRIDEADAAKAELRKLRSASATDSAAARAELDRLKQQVADAEDARAQLDEANARLARAEAAEAELVRARAELARLEGVDAEVEALRQQVARADAAQTELERLRGSAEKLAETEARLDTLQSELAQARSARVEAERARDAEIARLQKELESARSEAAAASKASQDANQAEVARLQKELEAARKASAAGPAKTPSATAPLNTSVAAASTATGSSSGAPLDRTVAGDAPGVRDIRFEKDGATSRVIVELDKKPEYHTTPWKQGAATLVLERSSLPASLERKLDTRAFRGPVHFVSSFADGDDVQLVAQIDGAGSEVVRVDGRTLIWEFTESSGDEDEGLFAAGGSTKDENTFVDRRKHVRINAQQPGATGAVDDDDITVRFGKRETLQRGRLSRRRLTLDVRDANITDILRLIADEVGVSIVTSPEVSGTVTLSLKSVPLDQALDIILRSRDLGMKQEGNIIWVAPAEVFRAEQERELEAALVREALEPLEVRLIPVNYATAGELQGNVAGLLSERGSVQIDPRTNTLIVKDVGANLNAVEILVESLDTQTPQILIEARIVETQSNYSHEIGVQWGGDFSFSPANGNPTGLAFPSTIGVAGGSTADQNAGTSANPNFAVNLPAAVGTGSGGALGMTFGSVGGAVNLNLRLSALEEKGFVKIISAPRVMTLDNVQATIEQGVSIPVSVVSAAGVQTVFFDAVLNLSVTPHVTKDGNIFLVIDVTKNEPDFANTGAQGDPSIIRKEAHTQLLIPDGDTTVIGGIYTRNTAQGVSSVPFFGDIPFLGYFFRNTSETDNRTELLIFVTPRIINREASIGAGGPGSFIPPQAEESQ